MIPLTPEQTQLLRRTLTRELSEDEHELFLNVCHRSGLDPFSRHLYPLRKNGRLTFESTIDGFRFSAEQTGKYAGQLGPEWCGPDGVWRDIWTGDEPPTAARVGILRSDFRKPVWGKALYAEYVQLEHGEPTQFWDRMAANQLAKCAEALGFRKAFPREFSGIYTSDEMAQASSVSATGSRLSRRENQSERGGGLSIAATSSSGGVFGIPVSSSDSSSRAVEEPVQIRPTGIPAPLQPFFEAGLTNRSNLQAAYGFIQLELEHKLGPDGLPAFRSIYAKHLGHGLFTSRAKCEAANRACMLELWGAVEAKREAA
jgi:phage recombination protein Bet